MQSSQTAEASLQGDPTPVVLKQFLQFFIPIAAMIVLGSLLLVRSAIN